MARALAADPPVLLMDEPFGAVDPITRQRLQDELLRVQEEVGKTIVFVTHDFDEAVKLGDRIVIFNAGAEVVQYDTPEAILANPAGEYVADFVGAGATLKALSLTRVRDVELAERTTARAGDDATSVVAAARAADQEYVVVLDDRDRPVSWLSLAELSMAPTVPGGVDAKLPPSARRPPSTTPWTPCSPPPRAGSSSPGAAGRSSAWSSSRPSWPRSRT